MENGGIFIFQYKIDKDVELKTLEINNAEELYDLINSCRLYLKEWLPWLNGAKSVEDIKNYIEKSKKQFALNNGFQSGIWYKQNLAGVIGYHKIDWSNKSANIGYWLGEDYQGKGIMTKATKIFVEYAFTELSLTRVEIRCAEKNFKSRAIPERLGFANEGISREREWLYDHYVNHFIYGIEKSSLI